MKECLGEHSQSYQLSMTEGQLFTQAEQFHQDGVYSPDIGDLVIAALSNVLQTALVAFKSRPRQPIHIQHTMHSPMKNPHPIHLTYLQLGCGHCDVVIHAMTSERKLENPTVVSATKEADRCCSCGRKTTKGNACSFSLVHYICRRPCYKKKQACTEHCKCKGCTSSFGMKPSAQSPKVGQKCPEPHESQSEDSGEVHSV